ncbi:MAG: FkbM family methyltransferase [Candidatus Omnitrophica bacterium]|nr:FkbM family methyltransferase [Candidatus Omnitrophota bacterium]
MKGDYKRISAHHIGGRNGSRAFPLLKKFEKDIVNVLYDADSNCLEHVREVNQNRKSELHVLPYCVGDICKTTSFNINYDPFTSSLYDVNPDYKSYYYFSGDHDYVLSEVTQTVEKSSVNVVSMDYIFQSTNTSIPPPDFLSMDTQGAEYEILQGAKETLKSNVLAIVLEAEFQPIYKGQKLFGDLVTFLSSQGFEFIRFLGIHEFTPFRAPIGLRGEGSHTFCDALFFRRIDNLDNKDELKRYIMLKKLAFIAIAFNQFEYGVECLRRSRCLDSDHLSRKEDLPNYFLFLSELQRQIEQMPAVYPPSFVSRFPSFEESKLRFQCHAIKRKEIAKRRGVFNRIKQSLREIGIIYALLREIKQFTDKVFTKVYSCGKKMFCRDTGVENILIKYGLKKQAQILKKNRIIQG